MICKKDKQPEHLIHKIIIIECPIYEKMIEENNNHYCPSVRETNLIILTDILWWDTIHSESQTPLDLTKE